MCSSCGPDYGYDAEPYDYDPRGSFDSIDEEYERWLDEQYEMEMANKVEPDEVIASEADLDDASLAALDALNERDIDSPPQPPAELVEAWAAIDAQRYAL